MGFGLTGEYEPASLSVTCRGRHRSSVHRSWFDGRRLGSRCVVVVLPRITSYNRTQHPAHHDKCKMVFNCWCGVPTTNGQAAILSERARRLERISLLSKQQIRLFVFNYRNNSIPRGAPPLNDWLQLYVGDTMMGDGGWRRKRASIMAEGNLIIIGAQ